MSHQKSSMQRRKELIVGIIAFVIQGSWTLWANWTHGLCTATRSSIMQGLLSGISAALMTLVMEWLFNVLPNTRWRSFMCSMLTSIFMLALILIMHLMIGTPELLTTLLLPSIAIISYALVYTLHLSKINPIRNASDPSSRPSS